MGSALDLLAGSQEEFWLPVQGNSMLPLIRAGDLLVVKRSAANPQQGEVWAFRRGDGLIAHRVLRVFPEEAGSMSYLARGDHATAPDPIFGKEEVVGRVVAIRRGERQMRLDSPGWQAAERVIRLAALGRSKSERTRGEVRFWRLTNRLESSGFSLLLSALRAVFGRWED